MQQRSQDTHNRILMAAVSEFSQNGYDATSVAQICNAASVSKGAFYHHFTSKQALFLELFESWLNLLDQQLNLIRSQANSVPDALILMTDLMGDIYRSAGGNLPIFLEFWNQARHDPDVWQEVIDPYRRYQQYFANIIQEGITEGTLMEVDPQSTAQVMVSLAVGLLLQGTLDPEGSDWPKVTRYGFQLILNDLLL